MIGELRQNLEAETFTIKGFGFRQAAGRTGDAQNRG
jgi:hypothetical protein